ATDRVEELDLRCGELGRRGDDVEVARLRRPDDLVEADLRVDEDVGDVLVDAIQIDAQPDREIRLRVEVEAEDPLADRGERATEVDGGRGLAHAAFLVRDRDHLSHAVPPRDVLPTNAHARAEAARCSPRERSSVAYPEDECKSENR